MSFRQYPILASIGVDQGESLIDSRQHSQEVPFRRHPSLASIGVAQGESLSVFRCLLRGEYRSNDGTGNQKGQEIAYNTVAGSASWIINIGMGIQYCTRF